MSERRIKRTRIIAKVSIRNTTHGVRRETLTRDRNNGNKDTEERALDISTIL